MANNPSAEKRHRQSEKKRQANRYERTTVRTYAKAVLEAVEAENADQAEAALKTAVSKIDKATSKGIYKPRTASRKIARLSKKVHQLRSS